MLGSSIECIVIWEGTGVGMFEALKKAGEPIRFLIGFNKPRNIVPELHVDILKVLRIMLIKRGTLKSQLGITYSN